jgi:glucarate dehydratase
MKVTQVVVTPVAFADPPLLNSVGVHEPFAIRAVVQVHTDEGLTGLGETYGDDGHVAMLEAVARALPGTDPFDTTAIVRITAQTLGSATVRADLHGLTGAATPPKTLASVVSPFEVAFFDIVGKAVGRPVVDLLGGPVRTEVPFSAYLFYKWAAQPGSDDDAWGAALDAGGIVAQARRMVDLYGFESLKLKGGVLHADDEADAVEALRVEFPSHPLRIDPNATWDVPTSIRIGQRLDGVLEYLEDPTRGIPAMAEVHRDVPMPLATNMCVVAFEHIPESVRLDAVQVILSDHHYWGGLRASQHLASIADTFGIGLSMHSNSHLGISLAAMVHLAAATPNLNYDLDTHWPWKRADEDVVTHPFSFSGGKLTVPSTPGLGIELDPDALARLHEQYLTSGIKRRDDAGYIKRVAPDWVLRPGL